MKMFCKLKLFVSVLMLAVSMTVAAQSTGDKLFMEGQSLQRTQTVAAQTQAIKKFQAAKVAYTTADKKRMCENQIAICNSNLKSIRGGSGRVRHQKTVVEVAPEVKFELGQNEVGFDGDKPGTFNVPVTAKDMNWNFKVSEGVEGEETFAKVNRSNDAKSVDIEVESNPTTLQRHQTVNFTYGDENQTLTIVQKGKPVTLSTDENTLEFGVKGGKKSLEVYTNSDSTVVSNNNQTWYVESKPDWIDYTIEVKKKKGIFGKVSSFVKKTVSGGAAAADGSDVKITEIKVVAQPVNKYLPEFNTGRRGEIVFASQDQRYKVLVVQQK